MTVTMTSGLRLNVEGVGIAMAACRRCEAYR